MTGQDKSVHLSVSLSVLARVLLIIILLIGVFMVAVPDGAEENDASIVVRLTPDAYAEVDNIETVHMIDYGSFVWLELTPSNFVQLRESGVEFERQRDPGVFKIQGYSIYTTGESSYLAAAAPKGGSLGFYMVQILGPAKDDWITTLEDSGLEILQYFNPYVYLVRMAPEQASVVGALNFVRWVGPYLPEYRIDSDLLQYSGLIENVDVTIYDDSQVDDTLAAIELLGGTLVEREFARASDAFVTATFALPASALEPVAQQEKVAWLSYRPPVYDLEDEMSDQIIAGNFNPLNAGYQNWQTNNGVNGAGVTVALIDTGYDTGVDSTSHQDLSGRLIPVGTPTDTNGHGTHVGGIIAGNASIGTTDGSGFLLGLGVAPAANLVVRNFSSGTDAARQRDAVTNGAVASNNSYALHAAGIGYTSLDRTFDMLVRDADQNTTTVAEPLVIVFSAGNSGATGPTKEAKNVIAVANSLNQRTNTGTPNTANINNLRASSSRGPAGDGRVYPHVTAPGTNIVSTRSTQTGITLCTTIANNANAPAMNPTYSMCTGTSMAAPHVTGAVALITQWWNGFNAGANPSPAMVKALLVNGAVDMGTADIPNGNEGWGRINLSNIINTGVATQYFDQTTVFANTGGTWSTTFSPADPSQQVRVTLVWSDAPGPGTGGNPAALVNDLDLVVSDAATTFLGNVFVNGLSTTGGAADTVDNLENVFIQNPPASFTVTVTAAGINGDGVPYNGDTTDQDFALVCFNCIPNEPPVCDANGPYTAECGLDVTLDGSGSSDPDGDSLSFLWTGPFSGGTANGQMPIVQFPAPTGVKSVSLDVDDGLVTDSCAATVTIADTTPPNITSVTANPDRLWPPNHKMTTVDVGVSATDICDDMLICTIISVSSNEPVNGRGDGTTAPDWEITGGLTVNLRAERSGRGSGRVYTITVQCTDDSGNNTTETETVTVAHDQR